MQIVFLYICIFIQHIPGSCPSILIAILFSLSPLYFFHLHVFVIFCCFEKKKNAFGVHNFDFCCHFLIAQDHMITPCSQAEKSLLCSPNLTISQLFKKNYQTFLSSCGWVFLIHIYFNTYPPPLIVLIHGKHTRPYTAKLMFLGYHIDQRTPIGKTCDSFTLLVPI